MNATRLYTLKYGKNRQVLSVGRVQTPTLAMVVSRYNTIRNFKPQPYWELQTNYRDTLFRYEEGRFLTKDKGIAVADIVKEHPFEVVSIDKKKGKEYAPKLFDLTGLQVYANTKFGFTAEQTLNIAQKLYEQKVITYPRVDTTFLSNDLYPKIPTILKQLSNYKEICNPLLGKKIKKSSKVFNDKKVTDHHAIIPTGMESYLSEDQQKIYDIIVRRFVASFYPDCQVAHTHVTGKVSDYTFKTSGKQIIDPGFKVVFQLKEQDTESKDSILPDFKEGEKGQHEPSFLEKETKPPNQFTEASLLRAMETAGKDIDDDEMRDLMKENGIGRPSTRANIIETLFRRKYILRKKKQILPTTTGIELIDTIQNKLLKSAELTGSWERKLKEIERGDYAASSFIKQMSAMVDQLVYEVRSDTSPRSISSGGDISISEKKQTKKKANTILGQSCPKCSKGSMVKGTKAFGCTQFNSGCDFTLPFTYLGKKISENQYLRLIKKRQTVLLKGFKENGQKVNGCLLLDDHYNLKFDPENSKKEDHQPQTASCPKCKTGTLLKGKKAYGCSNYSKGCDFIYAFDDLRAQANGRKLSRELVLQIISGSDSQ